MQLHTLLTPTNVDRIYRDCVLTGNDISKYVARSIIVVFGYESCVMDKLRIFDNSLVINSFLTQLPPEFYSEKGAPFRLLIYNANGNLWCNKYTTNSVINLFFLLTADQKLEPNVSLNKPSQMDLVDFYFRVPK